VEVRRNRKKKNHFLAETLTGRSPPKRRHIAATPSVKFSSKSFTVGDG
jgi:hypothetical protein